MFDKLASLTPLVRSILCDKVTEYPRLGTYVAMTRGCYLCRRCGFPLFKGHDQFEAGCGWPSFDDALADHVKQQRDADGFRIEIICARCSGHLGHVFMNEGFTYKNQRFCVNAASMDYTLVEEVSDTEEIILAGGCFWGIEHHLRTLPGVVKTEVGYVGGTLAEPSYENVCCGDTGHYEAVRVIYDLEKTDLRHVVKRFFEIHDPTQSMRQGADVGHQYHSAIFYYNQTQLNLVRELIGILKQRGYDVTTHVLPMQIFWRAEEYHQAYYTKTNHPTPCHPPVSRFG